MKGRGDWARKSKEKEKPKGNEIASPIRGAKGRERSPRIVRAESKTSAGEDGRRYAGKRKWEHLTGFLRQTLRQTDVFHL